MRKVHLILIILLLTSFFGWSQTDPVFRATKEEKLVFGKERSISKVQIHSEQTNLNIQSWDKDYVELFIVNSSRHPDKAKASGGLSSIEFINEQHRDKLFIRKIVSRESNTSQNSPTLFSELTLMVPEGSVVQVNNKVGKVEVLSSKFELIGSLELCQLKIYSSQLTINISQNFGETIISDSWIKGNLKLNRVNTSLFNVSGELEVNSQWGSLTLEPTHSSFELLAKIDKTDFNIRRFSMDNHQLLLNAKNTKIEISPDINLSFTESHDDLSLTHSPGNTLVNLTLQSHFGVIRISH